MKKIGILSGMGAAAGARFYDLLVQRCQDNGAILDNHFPEVILYNLPVEGMDSKGIANEELLKKELLKGIALLNTAAVDVIIIACNSVHIFHGFLQEKSKAIILNMIKITAFFCKEHKKVGVLSSFTTKRAKLYEKALKKQKCKTIHPTDEQQDMIDTIIGKVISGKHGFAEKEMLADIIKTMLDNGAEKIILGCTELPIVSFPCLHVIDAGQVTINEALSL